MSLKWIDFLKVGRCICLWKSTVATIQFPISTSMEHILEAIVSLWKVSIAAKFKGLLMLPLQMFRPNLNLLKWMGIKTRIMVHHIRLSLPCMLIRLDRTLHWQAVIMVVQTRTQWVTKAVQTKTACASFPQAQLYSRRSWSLRQRSKWILKTSHISKYHFHTSRIGSTKIHSTRALSRVDPNKTGFKLKLLSGQLMSLW